MSQKLIDGKRLDINRLRVGKIVSLGEALTEYGHIQFQPSKGGWKVLKLKRGEHIHTVWLRGYKLHNSSLNPRNKSISPVFYGEIVALIDAKSDKVIGINH